MVFKDLAHWPRLTVEGSWKFGFESPSAECFHRRVQGWTTIVDMSFVRSRLTEVRPDYNRPTVLLAAKPYGSVFYDKLTPFCSLAYRGPVSPTSGGWPKIKLDLTAAERLQSPLHSGAGHTIAATFSFAFPIMGSPCAKQTVSKSNERRPRNDSMRSARFVQYLSGKI